MTKMRLVHVFQGSDEWHEMRRTKIGASVSSALLGINPYMTAKDVYNSIVLGEKPYVSSAMQRGSDLEETARDYFNIRHACSFEPMVATNDDYPYMMASLDGISLYRDSILEIKCPGDRVYKDCESGNVPKHWEYQIQHQLAVTGIETAQLFVWKNQFENLTLVVIRDEKKILDITNACAKFYYENLLELIEPKTEGYEERCDQEWENDVTTYLTLKKECENLEVTLDIFRKKILEKTNGTPTKGCGVRVERSVMKGTIDYSKIPVLQGVNLDDYRKPTKIVWRICETKD